MDGIGKNLCRNRDHPEHRHTNGEVPSGECDAQVAGVEQDRSGSQGVVIWLVILRHQCSEARMMTTPLMGRRGQCKPRLPKRYRVAVLFCRGNHGRFFNRIGRKLPIDMNTDIFSDKKKSHSSEWLFSESWSGKRDSYLVSDPLKYKGLFSCRGRKRLDSGLVF